MRWSMKLGGGRVQPKKWILSSALYPTARTTYDFFVGRHLLLQAFGVSDFHYGAFLWWSFACFHRFLLTSVLTHMFCWPLLSSQKLDLHSEPSHRYVQHRLYNHYDVPNNLCGAQSKPRLVKFNVSVISPCYFSLCIRSQVAQFGYVFVFSSTMLASIPPIKCLSGTWHTFKIVFLVCKRGFYFTNWLSALQRELLLYKRSFYFTSTERLLYI